MRSNIPDGVPAMFFLCYHKATSRAPFILGANQETWGGLEPIQMIRRENRDHMLATYSTLVEEAFNALRETEDAVELPDGLHGKARQIQLSETRKLAIEYMRENPALADVPQEVEHLGHYLDSLSLMVSIVYSPTSPGWMGSSC